MSVFSFLKDAGEKISEFVSGSGGHEDAIKNRIQQLGLDVKNLGVNVTGDEATLTGTASNNEIMEKAILAAGNLLGIGKVNSQLQIPGKTTDAGPTTANQNTTSQQANATPVEAAASTVSATTTQPNFYQVKSGDTLSKIAKHFYGDANQYNKIFEANRPMLSDPDKIYPGQTLRIPDAQQSKNIAA